MLLHAVEQGVANAAQGAVHGTGRAGDALCDLVDLEIFVIAQKDKLAVLGGQLVQAGLKGLAAVIVTHDLAVARLLSHRMMVMKGGRVIEAGLTDRVLDDPREPYTQLLVSSILQV